MCEAGNAPITSGASPIEQYENCDFSTPGKGGAGLFSCGECPLNQVLGCSGARSSSSAVVPNRGHSETGDKDSHHLQLLLAHPGDGVEGTGSPCLHTAGSLCHLVELRGV